MLAIVELQRLTLLLLPSLTPLQLVTRGVIPRSSQYPQLTTNLTQIDIDDGTVDSDNANFIAVDFELRDVSGEGRSHSYAFLISVDHAFGTSNI